MNLLLIVGATLAQFVLGALWYSPLMFGKWWAQIMEMESMSKEDMQKMQKSMAPFYALQFVLTLITTYSFASLMMYLAVFNVYHLAIWMWFGFIAPFQIASVVWGSTKRKYWMKQLFVMCSMQLVGILLAAFILSL